MTHTRTRRRERAYGQAWRRQSYWVPEVTGTALATFTTAESAAVAVTTTGWVA